MTPSILPQVSSNPAIDLVALRTGLRALIGEKAGRFDVDALDECTSTNQLLHQRAGLGAPSGSAIIADRQTAGRGRRGRNWVSAQNDPEASLTFSLLWRFTPKQPSGLPLVVGIAVARALQKLGIPETRLGLKWPNDILLKIDGRWRKLGGILIELEPTPRKFARNERETTAIIGIGLNLDSNHLDDPSAPFTQAGGLPPAALTQAPAAACNASSGRIPILARILGELQALLDCFEQQGFAPFIDEWHRWHAWQGESVQLLAEGVCQYTGRALGVDATGSFLIETAEGIRQVWSGDVSLRPSGNK